MNTSIVFGILGVFAGILAAFNKVEPLSSWLGIIFIVLALLSVKNED